MRARGAGTKRKDGRWSVRVVVTYPDGSTKAKDCYGATQLEAQQAVREYEAMTGRNLAPKMAIRDLTKLFRELRTDLRSGTWRKYSPALNALDRRFGSVSVGSFQPEMMSTWMQEMKLAGVAGPTIQARKVVVSALFMWAQTMSLVRKNEFNDIPLPTGVSVKPKKKPKMNKWIYREILRQTTNPMWLDLFETLGEGGFRPDEAYDFTDESLIYRADMWWLHVDASKTESGENREVPIPDHLAHRLMERKGYLFPNTKGGRMSDRNFRERYWKPMVAAMGLEGLDIYQFRHFCLTRWALHYPKEITQDLAGHADIRTTHRFYLTLSRQDVEEFIWTQAFTGVSKSVSKPGGAPLGLDELGDI